MNWLHLRQTSSVRNTSDSGGPRLERVPGRSSTGASRGNLVHDLRRGRQSPAWIAFWALRMITLPRSDLYKAQSAGERGRKGGGGGREGDGRGTSPSQPHGSCTVCIVGVARVLHCLHCRSSEETSAMTSESIAHPAGSAGRGGVNGHIYSVMLP